MECLLTMEEKANYYHSYHLGSKYILPSPPYTNPRIVKPPNLPSCISVIFFPLHSKHLYSPQDYATLDKGV